MHVFLGSLGDSRWVSNRDLIVYVSGPRDDSVIYADQLTKECSRVVPLVMSFQEQALAEVGGQHSFEWWVDMRLLMVERADAMLALSNYSVTENMEQQLAWELGRPIFTACSDVVSWAHEMPKS